MGFTTPYGRIITAATFTVLRMRFIAHPGLRTPTVRAHLNQPKETT